MAHFITQIKEARRCKVRACCKITNILKVQGKGARYKKAPMNHFIIDSLTCALFLEPCALNQVCKQAIPQFRFKPGAFRGHYVPAIGNIE